MVNLSEFAEILESLMLEKELNASKLSKEVGINVSSISRYLRSERAPTVENIVKLADFFECSVEFLLGRETTQYKRSYFARPPFAEQLKVVKERYNCTWQYFYQTENISASRFYEWKNGKHSPSLDCVVTLADRFECTVDFILGRVRD